MPKQLTPIQAHRKRCLNCAGGSYKAVRECPETECESYFFRLGKNPNRIGIGGRRSAALDEHSEKRVG